MRIVPFAHQHVEQAQEIVKQRYRELRGYVGALPPAPPFPALGEFVRNGLGVAALEGEALIGFLCAVGPFSNAFHSTGAKGVFSPMHGNGALGANQASLYARMLAAAADIWAKSGVLSIGICLFPHDREVLEQFFRCGFGLRCLDAIRPMDPLPVAPAPGIAYAELRGCALEEAYPLHLLLDQHMAASPTFLLRKSDSLEKFISSCNSKENRCFVARAEGRPVAYLRTCAKGETFASEDPGVLNIWNAFCLPDFRGRGILPGLINHALESFPQGAYTALGVDFESINPSAYAFWRKHFQPYTSSVCRRIDEWAVSGIPDSAPGDCHSFQQHRLP